MYISYNSPLYLNYLNLYKILVLFDYINYLRYISVNCISSNFLNYVVYYRILEMKIVDDILEQRYLQTKIIPEIAVRWFEIGLELDIPNGTLEIIKTESDYSGACCLDMLRLWFNRGKNVEKESERPIWKNMYNAMCAIDINFRAEKLRDLLLKDIN